MDQYDTPLTPDQKKAFKAWGASQAKVTGRDPSTDTIDYDMQGWFKKNGPKDLTKGAHFTDEFKKPNHPTFSTESKYNGVGGNEGGVWGQETTGKYTFTPGKTNQIYHTPLELKQYFKRVEPDSKLNIQDRSTLLHPDSGF